MGKPGTVLLRTGLKAVFNVVGLAILVGCGPETSGVEDLRLRPVTLPDGREIKAEVMINPVEMARGMMYRESLPRGRGMLFIHQKPAPYRYWMTNMKISLDIIFMDSDRKIVDIAADAPPCTAKPNECPVYGGFHYEQFILELAAGEAKRLGLHEGQTLSF
jgi:uncharacterized membrane protein (UPF0127 family)